MRHQQGYIFRKGQSWFGRWYQDELQDGQTVRRQHCEKLAEYGDSYRTESDVRPLLDAKLRPLNERRATPESTLTVAQYVEGYFFPHIEREGLKPSTLSGYRSLWRMYLKPRPVLASKAMRDFRCVDAGSLLAEIHAKHGLSRRSLRHCKGLLSTIFTVAKNQGVLDGTNPVQDASIPRQAAKSGGTCAASPSEVAVMLDALTGTARAAIGLMYFAGLRPGEARGLRWSDYDGKRLYVRRSVWRTHVVEPKTAESVAPVPVCETLAAILADHRNGASEGDYILAGPSGSPADLHNLAARVVVPTLARCAECHKEKKQHANGHEFEPLPEWRGWYAFRRGAGTLATQVESPLAAKALLRHSNLATTLSHYVKDVPAEATRAAEKFDALFHAPSGQRVS